jgi:hypothetical protein
LGAAVQRQQRHAKEVLERYGGRRFPAVCKRAGELEHRKGVLGHKLDADGLEEMAEVYADASVTGKVKDWLTRSEDYQTMLARTADGRHYSQNAVNALLNNTHGLATALGINMADYKLFKEVQLWVNKGKGEYKIADIVLVNYNAGGDIADVIVIENKMGSLTDYTHRQKKGWKKLANGQPLEVKAGKTAENSGDELAAQKILSVPKSNAKKISDGGSKDGAFNVSTIPVNTYDNSRYTVK